MPSKAGDANDLKRMRGVVVGHGASPHPDHPEDGFVGLFVVLIPGQWVICGATAEFGGYNFAEARKGLGAPMDGEVFAPLAKRGVPTETDFAGLKDLFEKSWPDSEMEWLEERDDAPKVVIP